MTDMTRVKGMAGRRRRFALLAERDLGGLPHPPRVRLYHPLDDADLEVTIRSALCSTYSPLRAVVVVVTAGRVLLIGRLPSFYMKQVAQEAARRVPGVSGFENRLVVERPATAPTHTDDTSESIHPDGTSGDDGPSLDTRSSR
jgi:osmotically-inducible protein OsmY